MLRLRPTRTTPRASRCVPKGVYRGKGAANVCGVPVLVAGDVASSAAPCHVLPLRGRPNVPRLAKRSGGAGTAHAPRPHAVHRAPCIARHGSSLRLPWQLSSLVGAWAHLLARTGGTRGSARLLASGGMRYANKARCPKRDLACYFEPLSGCEASGDEKEARAAKTPEALPAELGQALGFHRSRDKWWLRRELTRFVFRPNAASAVLMLRVCTEMQISHASCLLPSLFNATVAATARQAATPRCLLPVPD